MSQSTRTKILLTGITGYIGGSIYKHLTQYPNISSYEITALLRSQEKAEKLKKLGINAVVGTHDDEALMESLAAEADIVIAAADADNVKAATATLAGLKKHFEKTGVAPIFIHTIETIPDWAPHRNVDLLLVKADKEGYVKTYIILPSTIYGLATGTLVDEGIQNHHSIQLPDLIRASYGRGRAGVIGQGKNMWPDVHIDDVAELYVVLLDAIQRDHSPGHGREGFYFGENGEHTIYELSKAVGGALVSLGKSDEADPTPFTKEDIDKYFKGVPGFGTNSRCRGSRSRSIGWKPTFTKEDLLASVKPEVDSLIKEGKL